MPVLAVAVFALLLFIHLVVQGARRRSHDDVMSKKSENSSLHSHEHTRMREGSCVIEEPVELHVNGSVSRMDENEGVQESTVTQFWPGRLSLCRAWNQTSVLKEKCRNPTIMWNQFWYKIKAEIYLAIRTTKLNARHGGFRMKRSALDSCQDGKLLSHDIDQDNYFRQCSDNELRNASCMRKHRTAWQETDSLNRP